MSRIVTLLAAVIALVAGFSVYNFWPEEKPDALIYEPPRALKPFTLESTAQGGVENDALKGQWTLLFTGYTFCPDICPTTLSDLKGIVPELQEEVSEPVKVWMISVDPKRDDMERLTQYVNYFGDNFVGVRAEHKNLFPFVRDLGLMYSIPDEDEENYLVNHSAAIILVNPNGHRKAIFNADYQRGQIPVVDMEQLAKDFAIIAD
ncbi:SCO family protein [Idiomarina aminovorans]|uniref:SCO family protein n=1 Tax=Idiomarina aminovorans TaxID=2914829 RepID=UPI0020062AB0|nr:SCO family protein [Idiomarina sp. ATCH4]MCK7458853.1 SCO family protein [Idiomarina sp. ATCH4]